MQAFTNKVGLLFTAAIVLSACGGGSDGSGGASSLVRVSAEPAGANCAAGGQRLLAGSDSNGDNQLQDGEVQLTTFACNGPSAKVHFDVARIAVGDLRCPAGGNLVSITDGSAAGVQLRVFCNGATGATGATGVAGAAGSAGPAGATGLAGTAGPEGPDGPTGEMGSPGGRGATGATGPATSEPLPLGQFLSSQIVKGAVLTCSSVLLTSSSSTCLDMKLNGLDILDTSDEAAALVLCAAITGKATASEGTTTSISDPYYVWSGSGWASGAGSRPRLSTLGCYI